jgi:hypothetical protein
MHNSNISPLRDLRFQGKSSHVHAFRSLPQQLGKIYVYIREIFNCLDFRIFFFNECVERGGVNSKGKVVAMYLLYGSLIQKLK